MNVQDHFPKSAADGSWYDKYEAKMGETAFWAYKNKLYDFLDKIEVGSFIEIEKWVSAENLDLFVKIAYCYVIESECCYAFAKNYSQIKRYFDASKMETAHRLPGKELPQKNSGTNGQRNKRGSGQPKAVPAP